jgi:hypothetical protein
MRLIVLLAGLGAIAGCSPTPAAVAPLASSSPTPVSHIATVPAASADADAKAWVDAAWKRAGVPGDARLTVAEAKARILAADPGLKTWTDDPIPNSAELSRGAFLDVEASPDDKTGAELGGIRYLENDEGHPPQRAARTRAIDDTVAALDAPVTPETISRITRALAARQNDVVEIRAGRVVFQVISDRASAGFRAYIDR